jgi:hypothetical protein
MDTFWGPENPSEETMRRHALNQLRQETGLNLTSLHGQPSRHCYLLGDAKNGCVVHLYTNKPNTRPGTHRIYYFGNSVEVWGLKRSFLILQCGLDFTVIAPLDPLHPYSWNRWMNKMGSSQSGTRLQQHIHWDGLGVRIKEKDFTATLSALYGGENSHPGWVNSFGLLSE